MRIALLCVVVAFGACAHAQTPPADVSAAELTASFERKLARGEAIVAEIGAMSAGDQFLRQLIIEGFQQPMSGETRQTFIDNTRPHFDRVDSANTDRLKAILNEIGWEELMALSPRAADQAFTLVSHSNDTAFKRQMVAIFEPLARAGRIPGERVAMLVDDIALEEGRSQTYGTNFSCRDGVFEPNPVEDMANLNTRRAALGMTTIEDYAVAQRQMYGACPTN